MRSIAVFAGKYETREERFGRLTIRAHACSAGRKNLLEQMPALAHKLLQFYGSVLGPSSVDDLDIIEVPGYLMGGGAVPLPGLTPAGMVLVARDVPRAGVRFLTTAITPEESARLAYGIAEQRLLHEAPPADSRDAWLSESLAEYLSGLAMASSRPDESAIDGFGRMLANWRTEAAWCAGSGSLETAASLSGEKGWRSRFCLLYDRGPLVLHMLHALVGDDAFFAILRRFLEQANGGLVTTSGFQKAAEEVLHQEMGWFFDDWYRKGGIPEIRIEKRIETVRAKPYLVVRAVQPAGPAFRRLYIPFIVDYRGGHLVAKLLFQDKPEVEARYELDRPPKSVTVDPAECTLAVYH